MAVRGVGAAAVTIAILTIVSPVRAQRSTPPRAEADCRSAYQAANERMHSGHLREASRFLQTCAKMQCESVLRRRCLATYVQLDSADIPTVIPVVRDDTGAERRDVQVTMDQEVLTTQIDGSALSVDPGLHEFSFSAEGKVFATQRVIVAQGQRNRTISASMPRLAGGPSQPAAALVPTPTSGPSASDNAPATPPTPAPSTPEGSAAAHSVSPWAFATGGVAGGGTVALLVLLGNRDTSTVLTDVSIGFSFGALVVATWVLLADRLKGDPVPPRTAYAVDVRPSTSGAVVSLRHTF